MWRIHVQINRTIVRTADSSATVRLDPTYCLEVVQILDAGADGDALCGSPVLAFDWDAVEVSLVGLGSSVLILVFSSSHLPPFSIIWRVLQTSDGKGRLTSLRNSTVRSAILLVSGIWKCGFSAVT